MEPLEQPLGRTTWAFAGGHLPDGSTGHQPTFTSRDEVCLLNTGPAEACVHLSVYHPDRDPVGPYEIRVPGRRVRHVRLTDLIDPEAVPLGRPYALVVRSDQPVVAQLRHLDTRQAALGVAITSGWAGET